MFEFHEFTGKQSGEAMSRKLDGWINGGKKRLKPLSELCTLRSDVQKISADYSMSATS